MSRIRWYGPTLVLFLTVVAMMLVGPSVARQLVFAQTQAQAEQSREQLKDNQALENLSESFHQVAQAVEPSVVHIQVLSEREEQQQRMPEDMLRRFFGPDFRERMPEQQQRPEPGPPGRDDDMQQYNAPQVRGNGSGWVYNKEGHIITNNHVVANADKIRVRFHNGDERIAKVVGTDPQTDVAVLKVDALEKRGSTDVEKRKQMIRQKLRQQRLQEEIDSYVSKLRKRAFVDVKL